MNAPYVRYWHKADIAWCTAHVRFWGKSGHLLDHTGILYPPVMPWREG